MKYPKLNILVAFPYFKKSIYDLLNNKDPEKFRLIVDSGAFTAWNTGREINFDDYCKFLKTIPSKWEYKAVQLDVFGDAEKTYINYQKMLDLGFNDIMPVFTRGDTLERLEEFYTHTDYIMFGGIVVGGENKNYVKWFCEQNKGRKAHWLGFVNTDFMKKYKPYSVDSSTVFGTQRFGSMYVPTGYGELKVVRKKEFAKRPADWVIKGLMRSGCTMADIQLLSKSEAWAGGATQDTIDGKILKGTASFMGIKGHVKRAVDVEKHLGTKIYFAVGNASQLENIFSAYDQLIERNCI